MIIKKINHCVACRSYDRGHILSQLIVYRLKPSLCWCGEKEVGELLMILLCQTPERADKEDRREKNMPA